jgi:hypothetical protein
VAPAPAVAARSQPKPKAATPPPHVATVTATATAAAAAIPASAPPPATATAVPTVGTAAASPGIPGVAGLPLRDIDDGSPSSVNYEGKALLYNPTLENRVFVLGSPIRIGRRQTVQSDGSPEINFATAPTATLISRDHALIERRADGQWVLTNLGRNGTRILLPGRQERLLKVADHEVLQDGALITIEKELLYFYTDPLRYLPQKYKRVQPRPQFIRDWNIPT